MSTIDKIHERIDDLYKELNDLKCAPPTEEVAKSIKDKEHELIVLKLGFDPSQQKDHESTW